MSATTTEKVNLNEFVDWASQDPDHRKVEITINRGGNVDVFVWDNSIVLNGCQRVKNVSEITFDSAIERDRREYERLKVIFEKAANQ